MSLKSVSLMIINTMSTFPHLYKKRKDGKLHKWMIWTDGDRLCKQDHLVGGKKKDPTVKFCDGTNIGKKNEKSPEAQAIAEANRTWAKMLDRGYKPDSSDTKGQTLYQQVMQAKHESGNKNYQVMERARKIDVEKEYTYSQNISLYPMLAMEWSKKKTKIDLENGAYIQPKIDGVRCLARINKGKVLLTSRTGKLFPHFDHIKRALIFMLAKNPKVILDGELYTHSLHLSNENEELDKTQRWELISGICSVSRKQPHEREELISFYVFDIYDTEGIFTQKERFDALDEIFKKWSRIKLTIPGAIVQLKTEIVHSEEEIMEKHDEWVEDSYEGIIVRDKRSKYLPGPTKRSEFLLKYKSFDTDEFTIVDAKEGKATEKGCVIWICSTHDGRRFACRPQGNRDKRKKWWENQASFLGKDLTIKYQGMDSNTNIPRFPVGIDIDRFSKE